MRRIAAALFAVCAVLAVPEATAAPTPAPNPPGCVHGFTRSAYTAYARVAYHDRHLPSPGQRRALGIIGRCQYRPTAIPGLRRYRARLHYRVLWNRNLTNDVVGPDGTSWFSGERTADSGNADRPCIAIRDTSTLGAYYYVQVFDGHRRHRHAATLLHCDSGPYVAGRSIDITPLGLYRLGKSPAGYCNCQGQATRLRHYMEPPG